MPRGVRINDLEAELSDEGEWSGSNKSFTNAIRQVSNLVRQEIGPSDGRFLPALLRRVAEKTGAKVFDDTEYPSSPNNVDY